MKACIVSQAVRMECYDFPLKSFTARSYDSIKFCPDSHWLQPSIRSMGIASEENLGQICHMFNFGWWFKENLLLSRWNDISILMPPNWSQYMHFWMHVMAPMRSHELPPWPWVLVRKFSWGIINPFGTWIIGFLILMSGVMQNPVLHRISYSPQKQQQGERVR